MSESDPPTHRLDLLTRLYGPETAAEIAPRVEALISDATAGSAAVPVDDRAVWLIAYPDHFQSTERSPLAELDRVLDAEFTGLVDGVHILPFYPWSSDGGFAVKDYESVEPTYGGWSDVESLARRRTVMFDAVINHLSTESIWFERFLDGDPDMAGFFRTGDPSSDWSSVVRPRTHPLFTPFTTASGDTVHVWTTFSEDQADLDYANPEVLLRILEVLVDYAGHGAGAIRLDAIGFLWKDEATASIHLRQTHDAIKLMRSCIDAVSPSTILISETNVPHAENVSYLALDTPDEPEVSAVYQFPLAPLTAHAALTGDTQPLVEWAAGIDGYITADHTFLNFLASHDGIGVRPAEGLLQPDDIDRLVAACEAVGGRINRRSLPDGTTAPYELNTTWFDLMGFGVDEDTAIRRHLATHAVMLSLPGIAAIYAHSFFGSSNDHEGFARSGQNRDLNRARFVDLEAPTGRAAAVLDGLRALITVRHRSVAFHIHGRSRMLDAPPGVFAIERTHDGHRARVFVNLTGDSKQLGTGTVLGPWSHHITT